MRSSRVGASERAVAERGCTSMIDISPSMSLGPEDRDALLAPAAALFQHLDLAVEHDEHVVTRVALLEDGRARADETLLQRAREVREHLVGERAEEADLAEAIDARRLERGLRDGDARLTHGASSLTKTMRLRPGPA